MKKTKKDPRRKACQFIKAVLGDDNVKAMDKLEEMVREKVARRISQTLDD